MKKLLAASLLLICALGLWAGCQKEQPQLPQNSQIANPWSDWQTIREAQAQTGFDFGLPETIADTYTAESVRTMNAELIEVVYGDAEHKICVRKQKGENMDVSGDYNTYENSVKKDFHGGTLEEFYNSGDAAVKQLISYQGYSWSLVAPNGYKEGTNEDFLNAILGK